MHGLVEVDAEKRVDVCSARLYTLTAHLLVRETVLAAVCAAHPFDAY